MTRREDKDKKKQDEIDAILNPDRFGTFAEWQQRKYHWRNDCNIAGKDLRYMVVSQFLIEHPTATYEDMERILKVNYVTLRKYWNDPKFKKIMDSEINRMFENEIKPRAVGHIVNAIREGDLNVILKVVYTAGWHKDFAKNKGGTGKDGEEGGFDDGEGGKLDMDEIIKKLSKEGNLLDKINKVEREMKELADKKKFEMVGNIKEGRERKTKEDAEVAELDEINAKEKSNEMLRLMVDGLAGNKKRDKTGSGEREEGLSEETDDDGEEGGDGE